jgi:hypothetical protein
MSNNQKHEKMNTLTKAQEKNMKNSIERFTFLLNANLKEFKSLYLKSTIEFGLKMEQQQYDATINRINETSFNEVDANNRIAIVNKRRDPEMLQTLQYINEANVSFNKKIASMAQKMYEAKINYVYCRFHMVSGGTPSEFSFLISDDQIELHARTIFACGMINAPHFRFITTIRNK